MTNDKCRLCAGSRGGTPGNENIIQLAGLDVVVCDYCHARLMADGATLRAMQEDVRRWTIEKGWVDDRTVGDLLLLMVSEIAEAYEEYRDHHEPNEIYVSHGKPEGIPIELADVVIRILSFCSKYGIDLQDAIEQKMAFNATRPHRHGGKRV